MASTYNSLGYQKMATGENAGTWGTKTNTTLDEIKETFGYTTVAMTEDRTLTIPDGSTGSFDGRAFIIECTGALGANRVLDIALQAGDPAANIEKPFIVYNNTSTAYSLTFKATGATGFVLKQGKTYLCYHNGTDIINTDIGSGGISWQAVKINSDSPITSVSGEGYFLNTTAGVITINLPTTPAQGDEIRFIDYAGTFDTNNLTVGRNGHKIQGLVSDLVVSTERAAFGLIYCDATQGWLLTEK